MCTASPSDKAGGNATTKQSPLAGCAGCIDLEVRGRGALLNGVWMQSMVFESYEQLNLALRKVEREMQRAGKVRFQL